MAEKILTLTLEMANCIGALSLPITKYTEHRRSTIIAAREHTISLQYTLIQLINTLKGKGSPYSITECRVVELIPVLGSQPAGEVSHKPGGRLPLLSARPAVTPPAIHTRAAINFAAR